jgi:hypothetical protein
LEAGFIEWDVPPCLFAFEVVMPQSYWLGIKAVVPVGFALFLAVPAAPQERQKVQQPSWSHAFDLKCRSSTQPKFDKDTKTFGFEVFRDDNNGKGLYIVETGDLGAVADLKEFKGSNAKSRAPEWLHGLDLKVRPAGIEDFAKARVFGLEVFRDENTGNLVYISEVGCFSVAQAVRGLAAPTPSPTAPRWVHGLDVKVRKAGVKAFDKDTRFWSIEVFIDDNTGNLIYMCESGMLAIVPSPKDGPAPTPNAKAPEWLHGLDLKVRKGGQQDFDPMTKSYGLEVFRDENNGNLIYISETGSISVVPGKQALRAPTPEDKLTQPVWTHGLDLKCRKFGQKDFTKDTPLFGVEVFNDDNTGCTIYIGETGAITAVASKQQGNPKS